MIQTVMRRFHLSSRSFPAWYIQQVVPAMSELSKRIHPLREDSASRPGLHRSAHSLGESAYPRDSSPSEIAPGPVGLLFIYCRSRFRGRELLTKIRANGDDAGGFRMTNIEEQFR